VLRVRPGVKLPDDANDQLKAHQGAVDAESSYAAQVEHAKARWERVKKTQPPFVAVKACLDRMCWGNRRCMYCEDSAADEIEHYQPKDLYPERCFVWENYLYACGTCNGPKNNCFSVIPAGQAQCLDVTRARQAQVLPPASGRPALINPREENPLDFLWLDLADTFHFTPRAGLTPEDRSRANYTIETLKLNRAYLVEGRRTAYEDRCAKAAAAPARRHDPRALAALQRAIEHTPHRSVWEEMKRQLERVADLELLFVDAPELLDW
jgi:uncharacterized protein (TIGR02646 family)